MKSLATKAVVTGPDGFYYREEHEWHNISDEAAREFSTFTQESQRLISQRGGKFDGNMTATLSSVVDGAPQPDIVVQGVSHDELAQFERHAAKFGQRLVDLGEQNAKKKRAQRGHGGGGRGRHESGNEAGN